MNDTARAALWFVFLIQFGWLWAHLPDWWWRPLVLLPFVFLALDWFEGSWQVRK